MNQTAALFNLRCKRCGDTLQSMTILLPLHKADPDTLPCQNSEHLAEHFVDPCPACHNHGRRTDCTICKGTNQVLTPILIEFEYHKAGMEVWQDCEIKFVRESLFDYYRNVDDVISAMYAGQPVRTPWYFFRVKARVNALEEVKL